jgi:hypothetical protein
VQGLVIEDVLDVPELCKLDASGFLLGGYKILGFDLKDGVSAVPLSKWSSESCLCSLTLKAMFRLSHITMKARVWVIFLICLRRSSPSVFNLAMASYFNNLLFNSFLFLILIEIK